MLGKCLECAACVAKNAVFTSAHCHSGGAGLFRALTSAFAFVAFDIFSAAAAQDIGTMDMLGCIVAAAMMIF